MNVQKSMMAAALLAAGAAFGAGPMTVDFDKPIGAFRRVNGIGGGPEFQGVIVETGQAVKRYAACGFTSVRLHDIPLIEDGFDLVDVNEIFPMFDVPEIAVDNPAFYRFKATDDYLALIYRAAPKADVTYRLGPSIDHGGVRRYRAFEPKDHLRYAKICERIIAHYTEGWADGFKLPIRHWEIWNEPDLVPAMWDKGDDMVSYTKFYIDVATYLKKRFPDLLFGGFTCTGFHRPANPGRYRKFLDRCRKAGAPLDFIAFHGYFTDPMSPVRSAAALRVLLDEHGYTKTEIHFNEWHYFPCQWSDLPRYDESKDAEGLSRWLESADGLNGSAAAAYIGVCLAKFEDSKIDVADYYTYRMKGWGWGLFDDADDPRATYHAFTAAAALRAGGEAVRVAASAEGDGMGVLASTAPDGVKRIYAASMNRTGASFPDAFEVRGVPASGTVRVTVVDRARPRVRTVAYADSRLNLSALSSGPAVYLVEFAAER